MLFRSYIAAIYAAMGDLLGGVHEKSYIWVVDARAAAYGYGGRTQERRYVAGANAPAGVDAQKRAA